MIKIDCSKISNLLGKDVIIRWQLDPTDPLAFKFLKFRAKKRKDLIRIIEFFVRNLFKNSKFSFFAKGDKYVIVNSVTGRTLIFSGVIPLAHGAVDCCDGGKLCFCQEDGAWCGIIASVRINSWLKEHAVGKFVSGRNLLWEANFSQAGSEFTTLVPVGFSICSLGELKLTIEASGRVLATAVLTSGLEIIYKIIYSPENF